MFMLRTIRERGERRREREKERLREWGSLVEEKEERERKRGERETEKLGGVCFISGFHTTCSYFMIFASVSERCSCSK